MELLLYIAVSFNRQDIRLLPGRWRFESSRRSFIARIHGKRESVQTWLSDGNWYTWLFQKQSLLGSTPRGATLAKNSVSLAQQAERPVEARGAQVRALGDTPSGYRVEASARALGACRQGSSPCTRTYNEGFAFHFSGYNEGLGREAAGDAACLSNTSGRVRVPYVPLWKVQLCGRHPASNTGAGYHPGVRLLSLPPTPACRTASGVLSRGHAVRLLGRGRVSWA